MTTAVKICGLSTPDTMEAALTAGADYVGLVHFPRSPRHVSLETGAELAALARGRAKIVALVVDADDDEIAAVARALQPDFIQAHGTETPARIATISALAAAPVIKAIKVETAQDVAGAAAYREVAALILFDAKPPSGLIDALPGGNGITFDWRLLAPQSGRPFMLSGGLNPSNVAEAIRLTQAPIVDVSSGVESAPGVKDATMIRNFIEAVRAAR